MAEGLPRMTAASLLKAAVEHEGYETPELNDALYLHFKGFRCIENLEPYTQLKALWLEANGFEVIEGLSHLKALRCLFLQRNLLHSLHGLQGLTGLVTLDVSENRIASLDGLAAVPALETLNVSKNNLATPESIAEVSKMLCLQNINLEHNKLEGEACIAVLAAAPALCGINIAGNPFNGIPQFRKKVINAMPLLAYLDRPIFEGERRSAVAWASGGAEAEHKARQDCAQEQKDKDRAAMQTFRDWQARCRKEFEERRSMDVEDTAAFKQTVALERAARNAAVDAEVQAEREATHAADCAALTNLGKLGDIYYKHGGNVDLANLPAEPDAAEAAEEAAEAPTLVDDADDRPVLPEAREPEDIQAQFDRSVRVAIQDDDGPLGDEAVLVSTEDATPDATENDDAESDPAVPEAPAVDAADAEEEGARAELVHESMALYKSLKAQKAAAPPPPAPRFEGPLPPPAPADAPAPVVVKVYWTEEMDAALAKLVRKHFYDFDLVADDLRRMKIDFGKPAVVVDAAACRERWCELDIGDSKPAVESTPPPIPAHFNGRVPTFAQLSAHAASLPSRVVPPTQLPSVDDYDDDDDETIFVAPQHCRNTDFSEYD